MSLPLELPAIELGVWCVSEPGDTGTVLGSGFFVAPNIFLTCAHVIESSEELYIRNADGSVELAVDGVEFAPDSSAMDIVLLTVGDSPKPVLACATVPSAGRTFRTRGFSSAAPSGRTCEMTARGKFCARYSKGQTDYEIIEALEFAGDMGSPGNSGAPILAPDMQAVVAVVCGGDTLEQRTWAIALSDAAAVFPSLHDAVAWNSENIPAFGNALNRPGLELAVISASKLALQRMREVKDVENTRIVAREQATQSIEAFLSSEPTTASVVGFSGIGKSWLLIDLVERYIVNHGILVAAADLASSNPKALRDLLHEWIALEFDNIDPDIGMPSADELDQAISRLSPALTVLVDGINEASDSRRFLSHWLPEAARWCKKIGGKLILSCRPEVWPTAYETFQDPKRELFEPPRTQSDQSHGGWNSTTESSSRFQISLVDFSGSEATQARQIYGLPENVENALMGNPLLYRISRRLLSEGEVAAGGTVATLRRYALTLLNDEYARAGFRSPRVLFDTLRSFANEAYGSENLSVEKGWAYTQFGDRNILDTFLASGLLVGYSEGFRFIYDDLVAALATVEIKTDELFCGAKAYQSEFQSRDVESLLRLEADGPESDFQIGLDQLVSALKGMGAYARSLSGHGPVQRYGMGEEAWQLLIQSVRLARSLPTSRRLEIETVYAQFPHAAEFAMSRWGIDDLVEWITEAPISDLARAKLLLGMAPFSDAWPLRHKDWVDRKRREDYFDRRIETGLPSASVAPSLNRLCVSNAKEVIPLLASHLTDGTVLDRGESDDSRGEATVGSMVGGILFKNRAGHVTELVDHALDGWNPSGRFLCEALAKSESQEVSTHVVRLLGDWSEEEGDICPLLQTLSWCVPGLNRAERSKVADAAEALRIVSEVGRRTQIHLLRTIAPDDLRIWDIAAEFSAETGDQYIIQPIPDERLDFFLSQCEAAPSTFLEALKSTEGGKVYQSKLAKRAKKWFAEGKITSQELGNLVENYLYAFTREGSSPDNEVWLAVAQELIDTRNHEARRYLIFPFTWDIAGPLTPHLRALEDCMVANGLDQEEFVSFKRKLLPVHAPWKSQDWVRRTRQVRLHDPKAWDEYMLVRFGSDADRQTALADYWAKLPPVARSEIASSVLSGIESGAGIEETFGKEVSRLRARLGLQ